MNNKLLLVSLVLLLGLSACNFDSTFEDDYNFDQGIWQMDDLVWFEFESDAEPQNIEVKIRSNLDYPFYNLYLKVELTDSLNSPIAEELLGFDLYDPSTGKPIGDGNSIFQLNITAFEALQMPYEGTYKIRLAQYMREEELPGILSAGVRIKDVDN